MLNKVLAWDCGVWNYGVIGNAISVRKMYLRYHELHPPRVFQEGFGKGPSQCVSNPELRSGWPVGDQWKFFHNSYSFLLGFGSGFCALCLWPHHVNMSFANIAVCKFLRPRSIKTRGGCVLWDLVSAVLVNMCNLFLFCT